jgi:hypothetical protein
MSRSVISSCAGAVSTNARNGLPVVLGEVSIEAQRVRSRDMVAPFTPPIVRHLAHVGASQN